jgi:hypothetical protein
MVTASVVAAVLFALFVVAVHDRVQKKHAIISNFPIVGHFRYWLEGIGGPLRQYIVTWVRKALVPRASNARARSRLRHD